MKKYFKYLIPSIVSLIILGIIYYFNGLYPFGEKPLVQVDADYIYIPVLYKIWDFLHYGGNIFYNDIGLGNSIYGSLIIQGSLFSPLNLLLLFVERNNIVNFFGLFIIIKICLISFTCYIYINSKYNKINYYYKVLFSVLYSFCGFVIFNYFNEIWLDIVILFPILILYLDKLLINGKELGYIIVLSLSLIITFYFTYFVVIFIIFYSFLYIYMLKRDKAKEIIFRLGKCTLIAFLISCFSSIPLMYQILHSSRFNGYMFAYMFTDIKMKSLYLLFCPLFVILFFRLVGKFKNNKVDVYRYIILFILYLIPVIINPINALFHGGNYWGLPYRYGFITAFILMDAALFYVFKYSNGNKKSKKNIFNYIYVILIVLLGGIGVYLNIKYRKGIITDGILLDIDSKIYIKIICIVLIIFIMNIISVLIKNKYLKYISLGVVSLYGIFMFTSWTIYYNSGYYLSNTANDINNNMKIDAKGRYKVDYQYITPYIGYIHQIDTLDNWVHIAPKSVVDTYKRLGYYVKDTRVYSYGGTIFTDYLLNFRYTFNTNNKINDNMFSYLDSYSRYNLYKINYNNNYGVVFDNIIDIDDGDYFDYQNQIYRNLFNSNKDIIQYKDYVFYDDEVEIEYNITDGGYLYLKSDVYSKINHLTINGNYYGEIDNYIKYLGYYSEDINIKIYLKNEFETELTLGFIKKDDIMNLHSDVQYKDNKYYVNSDGEKYLFLPINNIPGIHVYNNGKEVDVYKYLDNFICIKLFDGDNVVEINYNLPLFRLSIILSVIGLLLLIFKDKIVGNNLVFNITYYIYYIFVICVFLYLYLYPLFKYVL